MYHYPCGRATCASKPYLHLELPELRTKMFKLCALNSGYVWFIIVYTGKKAILESLLISKDTVKTTAVYLKFCGPPLHK
jgi:hypothetical protein